MSSNDNSQNNAFVNHSWNHNLVGEEDVLRPPNPTTQSRVLSRLQKNDLESKQDKADFSSPPPSGNQPPTAVSSQNSQQHLTLPVVPSQLSVNAAEFVPRSEQILLSDPYVGAEPSSDSAYDLSVSAPEFVPQVPGDYAFYTDPSYSNISYECFDQDSEYLLEELHGMTLYDQEFGPLCTYDVQSESTGAAILVRFHQALHALNLDPGNMEEYLHPICEMIQRSSDAVEIVNDVVESLLKQSLQEQNFRYTGARICQFLNSNLKSDPYFGGFHKIFIKRCQKEYNRREELKNGSPADQERLRGLAMFMAEIFLNVQTETEDGSTQRLKFLPSILVDFVKTLLSKPTDLDVKCAFQLLKLSGGLIEDAMKHSPEQCMKFEDIFTQMQSLKSSPELKENTKFLIDNIMKLKENDWNRRSSSPSNKTTVSFGSDPNRFKASELAYVGMNIPSEGVLPPESAEAGAYVLNDEEEAAYLAWQAEEEGLTDDQGPLVFHDTGYESYYLDEGGMGDEMEAAYEEFLQKETLMQGYQAHLPGRPEQSVLPPIHQIISHPPPSIPLRPTYNGFPPHVPPPNLQQNQMPQQHYDQQQQQQYQGQFPSNDHYHYHR